MAGILFQDEFGIPVYIDNDAQACALAEKMFGSCKIQVILFILQFLMVLAVRYS